MRNPKAKVSDPNKFYTDSGSDEHILYSSKVLPNGEIRLTECGKESISERINAQKEFTDIHYIISRLMMGDTSVIREGAVYGDFTKAPKNLAEALQLRLDAEKAFYELPVDVRNKFNNNLNQWIIDAGSPEWMTKMNIVQEKVEEKESVEVSES